MYELFSPVQLFFIFSSYFYKRKDENPKIHPGSGTIDPTFRAIWYGTGKLTANAMFWPELISSASMR